MARGWAAAKDIEGMLWNNTTIDEGHYQGCWNGMDSWKRNEMFWMDTCRFLVIFGLLIELLVELNLTNNSAISKRLIPPFQVHNDNTHFSLSLLQKLSPHVCVCTHLCVMYVCMHVYKHLCTHVQRSEEAIGYPVLSLCLIHRFWLDWLHSKLPESFRLYST